MSIIGDIWEERLGKLQKDAFRHYVAEQCKFYELYEEFTWEEMINNIIKFASIMGISYDSASYFICGEYEAYPQNESRKHFEDVIQSFYKTVNDSSLWGCDD